MGSKDHGTQVITLDEGVAQARCACGWRSEQFGVDKTDGAMDALQHAQDAADLHHWEASLGGS